MAEYGAEYAMISNWVAWGKLVRSWASGTNQVGKPYPHGDVPPLPQNMTEFIDQCAWAEVGLSLPHYYKSLQFVQSSDDTLLVRLPNKAMANLPITNSYKPPLFYFQYFRQTQDFDNDFRSARIGDYSISQCG